MTEEVKTEQTEDDNVTDINSKLEKIVEFKERSGGIYSNFSRPIIAGLENNP